MHVSSLAAIVQFDRDLLFVQLVWELIILIDGYLVKHSALILPTNVL